MVLPEEVEGQQLLPAEAAEMVHPQADMGMAAEEAVQLSEAVMAAMEAMVPPELW